MQNISTGQFIYIALVFQGKCLSHLPRRTAESGFNREKSLS